MLQMQCVTTYGSTSINVLIPTVPHYYCIAETKRQIDALQYSKEDQSVTTPETAALYAPGQLHDPTKQIKLTHTQHIKWHLVPTAL